MKEVFVNLKRFDVPRTLGGVCPASDPGEWIDETLNRCAQLGLGQLSGMRVVFMLPEALILPARRALNRLEAPQRATLAIGCQSVYRIDVGPGGNFGALTASLPAAAAQNMGCVATLIGHSEERRDKQGIIGAALPGWETNAQDYARVCAGVDGLLNQQALRAIARGLQVVFCVGETAQERGDGPAVAQEARVEQVLRAQIERGLAGMPADAQVVVGYEPVWAIGPGKTPPDAAAIAVVSALVKRICAQSLGRALPVVYGGGLKQENAAAIAAVDSIDGGLVALTRFSGDIGFYPEELRAIVDEYQKGAAL